MCVCGLRACRACGEAREKRDTGDGAGDGARDGAAFAADGERRGEAARLPLAGEACRSRDGGGAAPAAAGLRGG